MRKIYGPPKVYDVVAPLDHNGQPFLSVHVGVRTTLLPAVYEPWLKEALHADGVRAGHRAGGSHSCSATSRCSRWKRSACSWITGSAAGREARARKASAATRHCGQVSTKIERIGQRMRNVEEVFSALKENLDQILGNLQDGILLFTGDGRAVLVSEAARRFLDIGERKHPGLHAREIFDPSTVLGRTLREAFDAGVPW